MYSFPTLTEEDKQGAIEVAETLISDVEGAELVMLSFTGGRAFGWGHDRHDIDVHGFFAKDEWCHKIHSMLGMYDMTLQNVKDVNDPWFREKRWKQYYDKSNPFYIHDEFDFEEDFMDKCEKEYTGSIFPYDLKLQFSRLEHHFTPRNALHTYKEMLIPLHYIEHDEIDANVVGVINEHPDYQYPGLEQCADIYKNETGEDPDEELVWDELNALEERFEQAIREKTGYDRL